MSPGLIGAIPGVAVGSLFPDRQALRESGIHRPLQAGMCGSAAAGAESIVLNGGYEDDEDSLEAIVYTGHGGNDPATGKQIADQELRDTNLALAHSCQEGLPVRVVRGYKDPSGLGPKSGYRYDGLYRVEEYWQDQGLSGHRIWRYRLVPFESPADEVIAEVASAGQPAERKKTEVQRLVRNTTVTRQVKALHDNTCQVCGLRLETAAGAYAEGAHIRPLGAPHNGPDSVENVLCLCPNDHVRFDGGAIAVNSALEVIAADGSLIGPLRRHPSHRIAAEHLAYHQRIHGFAD
jgi:putative restriction endonuclease